MATAMDGKSTGSRTKCGTENNSHPDISEKNIHNEEESGELDKFLQLEECKKELNKVVLLQIDNTPAATDQDIFSLLSDYKISEVQLNKDGKKALVTLENADEAEEIVYLFDKAKMQENEITVKVIQCNHLICVAHLPLNFTTDKFKLLVSQYGNISRQFLFRSEDNGSIKGYGFVQFKGGNLEARKILREMDHTDVDGMRIHCELIKTSLVTDYSKLNSQCLLVDNLPKEYTDNSNFREVFSQHVSPVYCQIVLKNGDPIGYGIIEYKDGKEAEMTQRSLNGFDINKTAIRVTYCIPGMSAVDICARLLLKHQEDMMAKLKPSLLPNPIYPHQSVLSNAFVLDVCKEYPVLMDNFKEVLLQLQQTYIAEMNMKNTKPGLLGPAPSMCVNPLMNPNLQMGLIILMALQTQSGSTYPTAGPLNALNVLGEKAQQTSILGDPVSAQATIILQNLMSQIAPAQENTSPQTSGNSSKPILQSIVSNLENLNFNWLINLGQLTASMQPHEISALTTPNKPKGPQPLLSIKGLREPTRQNVNPMGQGGGNSEVKGLFGQGPISGSTPQNFIKNLQMLASQRTQRNELTSLLDNISDKQAGKSGFSLLGEPPGFDQADNMQGMNNSIGGQSGMNRIGMRQGQGMMGRGGMEGNASMAGRLGGSGGMDGRMGGNMGNARMGGGDGLLPDPDVSGFSRDSFNTMNRGNRLESWGQGPRGSHENFERQSSVGKKQEIPSLLGEYNSNTGVGNQGSRGYPGNFDKSGVGNQQPKSLLGNFGGSGPRGGNQDSKGYNFEQHYENYNNNQYYDEQRFNFGKGGDPASTMQSDDHYDQYYGKPSDRKFSKDDSTYGSFNRSRGSTSSQGCEDYGYQTADASSSFQRNSNNSYGRTSSVSSGGYDRGYDSFHQENNSTNNQEFENMAAKAKAYAAATNTNDSGYNSNNSSYSSAYNNFSFSNNNTAGGSYNNNYTAGNNNNIYNNSGSYNSSSNNTNSYNYNYQNQTPKGRPTGLMASPLPSMGPNSQPPALASTPLSSLPPKPQGFSFQRPKSDGLMPTPNTSMMPAQGKGLMPTPLMNFGPVGFQKDSQNSKNTDSTGLMKTPIGQKRTFSQLLPPPEPSPENDYIGQHSQGIGGHYADSYSVAKRQRLDNSNSSTSRYPAGY